MRAIWQSDLAARSSTWAPRTALVFEALRSRMSFHVNWLFIQPTMFHKGHVRGQGEAIPGGVLGGRAYQVLAKWRESAPVVWVTIN